jgi:hypothetical protein
VRWLVIALQKHFEATERIWQTENEHNKLQKKKQITQLERGDRKKMSNRDNWTSRKY